MPFWRCAYESGIPPVTTALRERRHAIEASGMPDNLYRTRTPRQRIRPKHIAADCRVDEDIRTEAPKVPHDAKPVPEVRDEQLAINAYCSIKWVPFVNKIK